MNIDFEEFSTKQDTLDFINEEIPGNRDEVFVARTKKRRCEYYVFYDEFDLEDFMKEHLTSGGSYGCYEGELANWKFEHHSYDDDTGEIKVGEVRLNVDYSLEINASY